MSETFDVFLKQQTPSKIAHSEEVVLDAQSKRIMRNGMEKSKNKSQRREAKLISLIETFFCFNWALCCVGLAFFFQRTLDLTNIFG